MRIWKRVPGFGMIDIMKVTAVGRHKAETYFKQYDVHCGGVVITLLERNMSRNDLLKLLPGHDTQPDEIWKD